VRASRAVTSALEGFAADAMVLRADASSPSSANALLSLSSSACFNSLCLASAICLASSACAAFSSGHLRIGGLCGRRNGLARGRKFALERERPSLTFVERLLHLLLFGIGDLLGLQCLCGIALARSGEIAGRDIIPRTDASSRASASDLLSLSSSACFSSFCLASVICLAPAPVRHFRARA